MGVLAEIGMGGDDPRRLRDIVPPSAEIWGVNSRKFEGCAETAKKSREEAARSGAEPMVSLALHRELRDLIPADKIAIAESGLHSADDLRTARACGYQAALIGTAFLKGPKAIQTVIAEFAELFPKRRQNTLDFRSPPRSSYRARLAAKSRCRWRAYVRACIM